MSVPANTIDPLHLSAWEDEVLIHCHTALGARDRFIALALNPETRQTRFVWAELHAYLTHTAMVSKLLFPLKGKCKPLAAAVRHRLSVPDDSPLKSREGRDNIEHIDERLADWATEGGAGLLEQVFENRNELGYLDEHRWQIRRALILDEWTLITTDRDGHRHETHLPPISEALIALLQEAEHQPALINFVGRN